MSVLPENRLIKLLREAMAKPLNFRRRLLVESKYTLPSTGDKAVMDLYALYALWWAEGSGREAYGYHPDSFSPHRREELVGKAFEDCLSTVAETLLKEARHALYEEAILCFDAHLIPAEVIISWARKREFVQSLHKLNQGPANFGYSEYHTLFSAPFWMEEADWYGGPKWAEITLAIQSLDAAFRRGKSVVLMGAVDRVFDIEHNTGALGSKLDKLRVSKDTLDLRAGFTSPQEFRPHVSGPVARLIRD